MFDSFIPDELAIAPDPVRPTPNLQLATVPLDAYDCFELWVPTAGVSLLESEVALLDSDRVRLESICARLTELLGLQLHHPDQAPTQATTDWSVVLQTLALSQPWAIAITYTPQAILPTPHLSQRPQQWTFHPPSWTLRFLQFEPTDQGYRTVPLPLQGHIAAGTAITGAAAMSLATVG